MVRYAALIRNFGTMQEFPNQGYDPDVIAELRAECADQGKTFVYTDEEEEDFVNDDLDDDEPRQFAQVMFIGKDAAGKEVIYDAMICTLRLHHGSMVFEQAVEEVKKMFPGYKLPEERQPGYKFDASKEQEVEETLADIIAEAEESESVKVREEVTVADEVDPDEIGIELDAYLNVEEINDNVISHFIEQFNSNSLKLDPTMYSFMSEDEEED